MSTSTRLFVCILAIIAAVPVFGQKKGSKDASKETIMYDSEGLKVVQEGSNNVIVVDQTDSTTTIQSNKEGVLIEQNGNKILHNRTSTNESSYSDSKSTNSAVISQSGNGNSIKIKQSGKGNSASVSQTGKRRKEE